MRPKERRESGQTDLFRGRLDQIVNMGHPLAKLGRAVDWRFLEERFGAAYSGEAGHPPLPTLLMAGLSILKAMHDLSDEALCERWVENLYFQLFCAEEFFQHKTPSSRRCSSRLRTSTSRRTPTLDVRSSPRTPNRPLLHGRLISVSAYHEATAGSFRSPPPICRRE